MSLRWFGDKVQRLDVISTPRDWALGSESYDEVRDVLEYVKLRVKFDILTTALVSSIFMRRMYPAKCAL
jgi:hypothetical protein